MLFAARRNVLFSTSGRSTAKTLTTYMYICSSTKKLSSVSGCGGHGRESPRACRQGTGHFVPSAFAFGFGGAFDDAVIYMENQVKKFYVEFEVSSNGNLCLFTHAPKVPHQIAWRSML